MSMVKVLNLLTLREALMDETVAGNYFTLDGRFVVGSPVNDARALRRSLIAEILAPTPTPPVNWTSVPTIASGSTDYMLPVGNYINEDPSKSLLTGPYSGRRIIVQGTSAGQPTRLRSAGDILDGYRCRWYLKWVWFESMNPGVFGQCPGRAVQGDEILWLEMYECFLDGTSGIMLNGKIVNGLTTWLGNPANGERIRIERNRVRNIRGQKSDGTRDADNPMRVIPIRSNFGQTHADKDYRWNPAVPLAERTTANKADPSKYGVIGWESVQFVMFRLLPGLRDSRVSHNEIVNYYGEARVEDNINFYGGSGGAQGDPVIVEGNYVEGGQGYDWNYVPRAGVPYDGSNQITLNAYGYQDVSKTQYSGSGAVDDDIFGDPVNGAWNRNGYVTWRDHTIVGNVASIQGGHDITMDGIHVYEVVKTRSGDPLKSARAGFQMTNYQGSKAAPDTTGVSRIIWGSNQLINSDYHGGTTAGGNLVDPNGDIVYNGGTYANNAKLARMPDGFEVQLLLDWRTTKANAGLTIGISA